jgi:hypothetical protein
MDHYDGPMDWYTEPPVLQAGQLMKGVSLMAETTEPQVNHQQNADAILAALQAATLRIPGFTFVPIGERRRVTVWANLPVAFLNAVAVALDASETLRNATGLTAAVMRDAIAFRNAYQGLADQLTLYGNGLRHTIAATLAVVGNAGLRAYEIAKAMNRASDRELLIPHIADMRRTLGKSRPSLPPAEPGAASAAAKPKEGKVTP